MSRRRVVPPDDELVRLGETMSHARIAAHYGVSAGAIHHHMRRIRLAREQAELEDFLAGIDAIVARVGALEDRVGELERDRRQLVPFVPDHRRLADGGLPVREQRRRARAG